MPFVYLHVVWFAAWILLGVEHYPYGLLTMIVSLEAIFLSTFVMISQTGPTRNARSWPTTSGRPSRKKSSRTSSCSTSPPDPGAHQGHPRHEHPPVTHRLERHRAGRQKLCPYAMGDDQE
jgi:hypothetical protein